MGKKFKMGSVKMNGHKEVKIGSNKEKLIQTGSVIRNLNEKTRSVGLEKK
jgi:hypothetical protein